MNIVLFNKDKKEFFFVRGDFLFLGHKTIFVRDGECETGFERTKYKLVSIDDFGVY